MICKVKYLDASINAYKGFGYTYTSKLPLRIYDKVFAPVMNDGKIVDKSAIVVEIDLPESTISPEWADKVKEIVKYDR